MKIIIKKNAKKKIKAQMAKDGFILEENTFEDMKKVMECLLSQKEFLFPTESVFFITDSDGFNANNSFFSTKKAFRISFTWLWIYRLHFYKSREIEVAFLATLGHEIGHSKAACRCPLFFVTKSLLDKSTKKEMFLLRTVEVYCDFNGVAVADVTREELVNAKNIEYVIGKDYKKLKKETDYIHPTHESRMEYLKEYNLFDRELIARIARDNGCYNQGVIESTWAYYQKVIENDGYIPMLIKLSVFVSIGFSVVLILILVCGGFSYLLGI